MWDAQGRCDNGGKPLPVLASWSFTTGEGGDFETLAAQLRMPPARDVGKAPLTTVGYRAGPVRCRARRCARRAGRRCRPCRRLPAAGQDLVAQQMALAVRPGDPELLGLPEYGLPWVAEPVHRHRGLGAAAARRCPRAHPRRHRGVGRGGGAGRADARRRAAGGGPAGCRGEDRAHGGRGGGIRIALGAGAADGADRPAHRARTARRPACSSRAAAPCWPMR